MRKDRLSSFQAKKQKLLKIKATLITCDAKVAGNIHALYENEVIYIDALKEIWEIVKDE